MENTIREKLIQMVDSLNEEFLSLNSTFLNMPELGYKEHRTSHFILRFLREHFPEAIVESGLGLTGIKARLSCGRPGRVNLGLICELDAVISLNHPHCDAATGAAHACGHSMQMAVMLGLILALKESGALRELCGSVTLLAVPAEEYVELEYRQRLRDEGKIRYLSGKQEFVWLGAFDDVDMVMMAHGQPRSRPGEFFMNGSSLGFVAKIVEFTGRESHAGASPHKGVNALNAANLALAGINANRETFRDEDSIRVHPIITKGGDLVNVVPAHVVMETFVRGKNREAVEKAAEKVDRSIFAGCYAVGAVGIIKNIPGYLPMLQDERLSALFAENAKTLTNEENIYVGVDMPGSSDIGDVSHLIPVIQPTIGGFSGEAHTSEFLMTDPSGTLAMTAKAVGLTVIDLLSHGCGKAMEIIADFKPTMEKDEYLAYLDASFEKRKGPDIGIN